MWTTTCLPAGALHTRSPRGSTSFIPKGRLPDAVTTGSSTPGVRSSPRVLRQAKDPAYYVKRGLPEPKGARQRGGPLVRPPSPDFAGLDEVCAARALGPADVVIRFDHEKGTFALYRDAGGGLFRDGRHLHPRQHAHLAGGLVISGRQIECPKPQWQVQPAGRLARAAPRLPGTRDHTRSRSAAAACALNVATPGPAARAPPLAEGLPAAGRQQPERRDLHPGAGPRACGPI